MIFTRTQQVKPNLELRLFAVLLGGALIAALVLSVKGDKFIFCEMG